MTPLSSKSLIVNALTLSRVPLIFVYLVFAILGNFSESYVYPLIAILAGMAAVGVPKDDEMVRAGINWLLAHQQPCGGWGETLQSYEDVSLRGTGTVTPSQTAWALLGLIGFGMADDPAVRAGIQWLAENQQEDGGWEQTVFTGTGFPAVFYLRYHFYHQYFPLMAISKWLKIVRESNQ